MRALRRVVVSAVVAMVVAPVGAQTGGVETGPESHGWMGVASPEGVGGRLLHLPPRSGGPGAAAEAGTARTARVLEGVPTAVTAWGRQAYLLFAEQADRLDVFSLRVSPAGISGAWLTDPVTGASAEPSLDLDGSEFVAAVGYAEGLVVLGRGRTAGDEASGGWRVWRLGGGGWERLATPRQLAESEAAWLVEGPPGPTLVAVDASGVRRWGFGGEQDGGWSSVQLPGAPAFLGEQILTAVSLGGDVCVVVREGGGVAVWSLGPSLVGRVAGAALAGAIVGLTPLESGDRLAVLSASADPAPAGSVGAESRWEIVELSLVTGRELYRGPLRHPSLSIGNEVRWLSLLMMAMTVFVLFYLLRPGVHVAEVRLPQGFALARPGRRLAGAFLDALLVAGVVSAVLGVPVQRFILVLPLFETAHGVLAFGVFVAGGAAYSTLCEWLWGRTIGKMMVGTRVVSVDPGRQRVGFMRSGARSVFRWALAPWALAGLGSPDHRHRGDLIAGAAVVVAVVREPGEEESEDAD